MYTVSPPGLKAILPVNLTFSHKVVELPLNMIDPSVFRSSKPRETVSVSNTGVLPEVPIAKPGTFGVIDDFQSPSSQPKTIVNMTENPEAVIAKKITEGDTMEIRNQKFFESTVNPSEQK